ncbi:hypothetical protein ACFE04_021413 [Oxalis oulophora]
MNTHVPFVSPSQFNLYADEINVEACKARMIRHENFQDYVLHLQNWRGNVLTLFMHMKMTKVIIWIKIPKMFLIQFNWDKHHSPFFIVADPSDYQEQDGTVRSHMAVVCHKDEEQVVRGGSEKRRTNNVPRQSYAWFHAFTGRHSLTEPLISRNTEILIHTATGECKDAA